MKKKILCTILTIAMVVLAVGCGKKKEDKTDNTNNTNQSQTQDTTDKTDTPDTTDKTDTTDVQTQATDPVEILNVIYNTVSEEDREYLPILGGDMSEENLRDGEAGVFSLADADYADTMLGIPAANVSMLTSAGAMFNAMNVNNLTCAALVVSDAANVKTVVDAIADNLMNRPWMCGMPDKLMIYTLDQTVISFFGLEEAETIIQNALESAYPNATLVFEEAIEVDFDFDAEW